MFDTNQTEFPANEWLHVNYFFFLHIHENRCTPGTLTIDTKSTPLNCWLCSVAALQTLFFFFVPPHRAPVIYLHSLWYLLLLRSSTG